MPRNSWLHLDTLRESWVFLLIGRIDLSDQQQGPQSSGEIDYWELGVGNPETLVETAASSILGQDVHSRNDLLAELLNAIREYRYQNTLLVTIDQSTLQQLRAEFVASDIETASLRGFVHVDVESQLVTHFGQSLADYGLSESDQRPPRVTDDTRQRVVSTGTVKRVWEVWCRLYRLVPGTVLEGEPL